jgi:cytoplasmic iron level regulating protein YaaA (DUF328/UPF0246 family)
MLAVLSPAKSLDLSPGPSKVPATDPALLADTEALMKTTRRLTQKKIRELMSLSADLAKLNYDRYRAFELPMTDDNAHVAAWTFAGDVYRGLDARSLSAADLRWAQDHVWILSGLYGVLRPLDRMQPYRLEMGTRLTTRRGKNLYQFWGAKVRETVAAALDDHEDPTLVNLASNEYFKVLQAKHLTREGRPIVACVFEDWKQRPDEGKTISFLAKVARGMMARWMVENRIDRADGLRDFALDRYKFVKKRSTPERLVFARKFVPAGG